jgi:hypothetical protein
MIPSDLLAVLTRGGLSLEAAQALVTFLLELQAQIAPSKGGAE